MYICSKLHSLKLFKTDCLSSCKITRKKKKEKGCWDVYCSSTDCRVSDTGHVMLSCS